MSMFSKVVCVAIAVSAVFTAGAVYAGSIGVNFVYDTTQTPLGSTDSTGVVAQTNWNNVGAAPSGTVAALNDDSGTASTASVDWTATNAWNNGIANPTTAIEKLFNGYVYGTSWQAQPPVDVTVSSIPYSMYDVYVYTVGNVNATTAVYSVTDGTDTYWGRNGIWNDFVQITDTTGTGTEGNYVKFAGNTAESFSFEVLYTPDCNAVCVGFQIVEVEVPEPGTIALLTVGLLGLIAYAWRKRQ